MYHQMLQMDFDEYFDATNITTFRYRNSLKKAKKMKKK